MDEIVFFFRIVYSIKNFIDWKHEILLNVGILHYLSLQTLFIIKTNKSFQIYIKRIKYCLYRNRNIEPGIKIIIKKKHRKTI